MHYYFIRFIKYNDISNYKTDNSWRLLKNDSITESVNYSSDAKSWNQNFSQIQWRVGPKPDVRDYQPGNDILKVIVMSSACSFNIWIFDFLFFQSEKTIIVIIYKYLRKIKHFKLRFCNENILQKYCNEKKWKWEKNFFARNKLFFWFCNNSLPLL